MSNSCNLMEKWPKVLHTYTYYSNQITIIIMSINFCIICSLEIFKRYWFKKENFTINITESGKSHYCYGNSHPIHSFPLSWDAEKLVSLYCWLTIYISGTSHFSLYIDFFYWYAAAEHASFLYSSAKKRNGAWGKQNNA